MPHGTPKGPRLTIKVTAEAIAAAIPRDSQHCMIADCIRVAYPDALNIGVDLATIRFSDPKKGLRYTYLTPRAAQVELVRFDQGKVGMQPFRFDLRGAHVTRMISKSKRTKRPVTPKMSAHLDKLKLTHQKIRKARTEQGNVAERTGGRTPPLQTGSDGVPFSRRRAFGLRALEF